MHGFLSGRFILVWRYFEVNCISLNRHVSDKDKQSKLYRNVQPVFSIDDEDDEGGTLLHVYSSYVLREVERRSSLTDLSLLIASNAPWSCICYLIPPKHLMNLHESTDLPSLIRVLALYWSIEKRVVHTDTVAHHQKNAKLYILKIWPKWTSRYFSKSIMLPFGSNKGHTTPM